MHFLFSLHRSVWTRLEQTSNDLERMVQEQRNKLERCACHFCYFSSHTSIYFLTIKKGRKKIIFRMYITSDNIIVR